MLPIDLFRIRLYSSSILTSVCSFIAQNVAMIALPFYFLNNYGFSEITTGLIMTPWPLATMIVSPIAARFVVALVFAIIGGTVSLTSSVKTGNR